MKNVVILSVFIICCCSLNAALNVTECLNGEKGIENIKQEIMVGRCKKPACRLRKGTIVPVEFKFTAPFNAPSLINRVWAKIVGIPFPFIGVDGTDACPSVYKEDRKTLAGCPLKKGEIYVFKNQFEILDIYPRIKLDVHWGLEGTSAFAVCFEVPARITN